MATASQVKSGLDAISGIIAKARKDVESAQESTANAVSLLNALPGDYQDLIATINTYGTTNAFEALAKAELAKLTTEFQALVAAGNTIVNTDLG